MPQGSDDPSLWWRTPSGAQEALRRIRKEKTEAITDSAQRAKIGQIQDLSEHQHYEDVLTREQALIAGHADMEFSGFLAVTAASRDELSAAVAQIEQAAAQASCETRVLYGRQAQGFVVAALPLARSRDVRVPHSPAEGTAHRC